MPFRPLDTTQIQSQNGFRPLTIDQSGAASMSAQTNLNQAITNNPNYFQRLGQAYSQAGQDIVSGVEKGGEQYLEGVKEGGISGLLKSTGGLLRSGLRAVGGVAKAAFIPITEAPIVKPVLENVVAPFVKLENVVAPLVKVGLDAMGATNWAQKHPEAAKDLSDIFSVATLPIAGEAKAITKGVGTASKSVAGRAFQSAITPTTQEAERILSYEAKTPFLKRAVGAFTGATEKAQPITRAKTALERGIAGTEKMVGVQAKRGAEKLWQEEVAPAVEASREIVTKNNLFTPIKKRIANTLEPGKKQALQDAYDAIKEDYKKINNLNLKTAQKLKSEIDEYTPQKLFKGKDVANEYNSLKHDMADAIRQKTYNAKDIDVNIKKSYLDYANLKELEKVGVKAISDSGLKGGFGSFWSTMWEKATTPIKTIGGQTLYKVGNVLEFVGNSNIKTFGEFLKSKGFDKLSIKK